MAITAKVAKVLRESGRPVAVGKQINERMPRGLTVVDGRNIHEPNSVFVSVVTPKPMCEGFSHEDMKVSSADEAEAVAILMANSGFVTFTPLSWFKNIHGKLFANRPLGGFYVSKI